jgi:hypothetical protein
MPQAVLFCFWYFFKAIFPPETIRAVALPDCCSEAIRIAFNPLNASNQAGYVRHLAV